MKAEFFTVAICTYNRAKVLPYAIRAALNQSMDCNQYEVLVVDNNCTDETQNVIKTFMETHPNIRTVSEKQQGLSFARNRAYSEARGDIIVYIDDDAEMCPDYLNGLKKVFDEEKNIGAVGGPIEVGWLGSVPEWYEPGLDRAFNYLYYGSFRMKLRYPRMIYGTNMAFTVSLLKKIGGFRTNLGRIGEHLLSGEDVEIMLRIQEDEHLQIIYEPVLKVRHLVSPERLSPEYIMEKAVWQGRSQYRLERLFHRKGGVRNAIWCLFESYVRVALGRAGGKFTEKLQRSLAKGIIREWLHGGK